MLIQKEIFEVIPKPNSNEKTGPIKAQDFIFIKLKGIGIVRVNSSLATYTNASNFKSFCDSVFKDNFNIIIDFSRCKILDSAFIGAIILSLKNSSIKNVKLKLVIGNYVHINYCQRKPIGELFKVFDSINDAIKSFQVD